MHEVTPKFLLLQINYNLISQNDHNIKVFFFNKLSKYLCNTQKVNKK